MEPNNNTHNQSIPAVMSVIEELLTKEDATKTLGFKMEVICLVYYTR